MCDLSRMFDVLRLYDEAKREILHRLVLKKTHSLVVGCPLPGAHDSLLSLLSPQKQKRPRRTRRLAET